MENSKQKQWWAPVWKGLVVDPKGKHYQKMKNAVWLYLYLLLHAKRGTGVLMRKIKTICADMGISRDTAIRWLGILREEDYIVTVNTGRSLTIQIKNWKPLAKYANIPRQMSDISNSCGEKYPTSDRPKSSPIPESNVPKSVSRPPPNKKNINILFTNETRFMQHATTHHPGDRRFTAIGSCAQQELLAWELAKTLDDPASIDIYRSHCRQYPEELLRKALKEAKAVPAYAVKKGRGPLFTYLLKYYAQGTTENFGD